MRQLKDLCGIFVIMRAYWLDSVFEEICIFKSAV